MPEVGEVKEITCLRYGNLEKRRIQFMATGKWQFIPGGGGNKPPKKKKKPEVEEEYDEDLGW